MSCWLVQTVLYKRETAEESTTHQQKAEVQQLNNKNNVSVKQLATLVYLFLVYMMTLFQ
jgi:hypothetical protein